MKSLVSGWTYRDIRSIIVNFLLLNAISITASVAAMMVRSRSLGLPRHYVLTITFGDSSSVKKWRRYPNSNQSWTEGVAGFATIFLLCTMILSVLCSCDE